MAPTAPAPEVLRLKIAAVTALALTATFAILLLPAFPLSLRGDVSSLGLLTAGTLAIASGFSRAARTSGAERRPWVLLSCAGLLPLSGNVWVAISGADPITSPSLASEGSITLGLMVSIVGVLAFPTARRRGLELAIMVLDGLVAGAALLIIFSVLVYSELLDSSAGSSPGDGSFALVIPVLDIVLATVALQLILRSVRSQRLTLGLVTIGFLLYAIADLTFAVRVARDTFEFGSVLDLGWIAGYLAIGLAAWVPVSWMRRPATSEGLGLSDALGTMLVFAVLLVAALVQVVFGGDARLVGAQATTWVVLILAVGARQIALTADNAALRRGLERRVTEQTADLSRLAHRTELLLESVGDGIYGVDRDGRITFVNVRASTSLGRAAADLHHHRPHEVFIADAGTGPTPWTGTAIHRAITGGIAVTSTDEVYRRADGSTFPVESTAAPLLEDNEVTGAVVVFRDVTQRREVDKMKNEFLAVVSHELRTPLTSIRASLELIEDGHLGDLPPRAGRMITVARESSERLTRLINDLLDIERIESGAAPMTITSLDARQLLIDAARHLDGVVGASGLRLEVGRANGRVLADEDQIMQALTNLVGNACKFSEPGTVVTLEAYEDGSRVRFSVEDRGRGIPEDKLHSVFERFVQVDSSDTREKGGTGLGLTITKGIVNRHGGEIWAQSAVGVGTTVSFTLPAAGRLPAAAPSTTDAGTADPPGATILVCDDDPAVVESLSAVLGVHGYRTVGAADGAEAISLISTEHPAVVLLDMLMPGTTGADVIDTMRSDESARTIPVVIVSGLGPEANPAVAGATDGWLVKPVSEQQLVRTVAVTLSGRPRGSTVLLVEDDDTLAEALATMLADEGLEVVRAATATDAIVRAKEVLPDVVVLDLLLPDGHGSDVVAELRRRGSLASTPLIVYSGTPVDRESRLDLRLGETTFLEKGRTGPRELRDRVLELISAATKPRDQATQTATSNGGDSRGGTTTKGS